MSIGLIAIGIVGSLFLHGNKLAAERSKQLMLAQDMNDALRMLKEDVLRAGYNEGNSSSFIVSGASKDSDLISIIRYRNLLNVWF